MKLHFHELVDLGTREDRVFQDEFARARAISANTLVSEGIFAATLLMRKDADRFAARGELGFSLLPLQGSLLYYKRMTLDDFKHGAGSPAFKALEAAIQVQCRSIQMIISLPGMNEDHQNVPHLYALFNKVDFLPSEYQATLFYERLRPSLSVCF